MSSSRIASRFLGEGRGCSRGWSSPVERRLERRKVAEQSRFVGIACSPRKGKTTAAAVETCLAAAKAVAPGSDRD